MKRALRMLAIYLLSLLFALLAVLASPVRVLRRILRQRGLSLWTGAPILTLPLKAMAKRLLGAKARSLVLTTYFITGAFDYDLSRWRSTAQPTLAQAPEHLAEPGRRGREYVEKYFSIEAVAERLGRAYRELGVTP